MKFKLLQYISFGILFIVYSCKNDSPKSSKISANKIIEAISDRKDIIIKDKTISDNLDFTTLPNPVLEAPGRAMVYINCPVTFINCFFEGKVIAYKIQKTGSSEVYYICNFSKNLTFLNCGFNQGADFSETDIQGFVSFNKSIFYKSAYFEGTRFYNKNNYFIESIFRDKANFQRARFDGNISFLKAEFIGNCSFQNTYFNGETMFGSSKFSGFADFTLLKSNLSFIMNNARFDSIVNFNYSQFRDRAEFNQCQFNNTMNFENSTFYGAARFKKAKFRHQFLFDKSVFLIKPDTSASITNLNIETLPEQD